MSWSRAFLPTQKETPAEAETVSHRLMLRAGLIEPLAAGIYIYLPLGMRALRKAERIVREEMDRAGAIELEMPALHPMSLWERTGRAQVLAPILLTFHPGGKGETFLLGPTHEEVITLIASLHISSYKQLPINLYQIQTKFRWEARPKGGVLRTREFLMKDAYSFHADDADLDREYHNMYGTYERIFKRAGLTAIGVQADSGAMGGSASAEFMVLAGAGEDAVAKCTACDFAANTEACECVAPPAAQPGAQPLAVIETPQVRTIAELTAFLTTTPDRFIKTLIYEVSAPGAPAQAVAVLVRGDHEVSDAKLAKVFPGKSVALADEKTIARVTGAPVGFAGPAGLACPLIADRSIQAMADAVSGANQKDRHVTGVNPGRDFRVDQYHDVRLVRPDDPCPRCGKPLALATGIEVGHVFKLGRRYTTALEARFLDPENHEQTLTMGCYGIGVNRILAAAIEQHHDDGGIIWPMSLAPYQVDLVLMNPQEEEARRLADRLYGELVAAGVEVIYDDRDARAGVKFSEGDLLGFPIRLAVGGRTLKEGKVELKERAKGRGEVEKLAPEAVVARVKEIIAREGT
jgi:prolyl-tRNA synthetase